ncbi:MAG: sialidase family protein [Frankiaceae bacterium]
MHLSRMRGRAALIATAVVTVAAATSLATVPTSATAAAASSYTAYLTTADGGEPSIGYDLARNAAMYGETSNVRLTWDDSTTPATMTVTDVTPATSATSADPITVTDQRTNRTFVSQLALACSLFSFSDDAGSTWTPGQGCGAGTVLDHQTVGGGPFHAGSPIQALTPYRDAVYYCAQNSYNGGCAVSQDGGLTFGTVVPAYDSPANDPDDPDPVIAAEGGACSALHGHLRVGPDGTAYLPIKGCGGSPTVDNLSNTEYFGGHPSVSVSTDNGLTYRVHRIDAGNNSDESDPSVAIGRGNKVAGGRIYLGWQDGTNPSATTYGTSSAAKIAVSTNHGTTWSAPVDVSTPLGIHNVQFPEVIAGDDDRAAFAWLGTTATGDDQHNGFVGPDGNPAAWHLYISTTYDGGATWTTVDATPNDPVQRGCIDLQGISNKTVTDSNICGQRNLLDFNDITVDGQGRVLVAFADGCTGSCVTDPTMLSTGDTGTVMRQSTGKGLYAAYDGTIGKKQH